MDGENNAASESEHSQSSQLDADALNEMEASAKPDSTKRATTYGIKKFRDWLAKRGKTCDLATVSPSELNTVLRSFYAEVKPSKQQGPGAGALTPSTLTCLRAAIHRCLTSAPYNRPFNIVKDREFTVANNMFTARCKLYFKAGNPKPQHQPAIGDGDMEKLGSYFLQWRDNPTILSEACWFFLCYNFGRRGREGWVKMSKSTFAVNTDSEGHEYVASTSTEVTKNHQGGNKQSQIDYDDQRMYGPGVEIFKVYLSKLNPECDRLFQTPLHAYKLDDIWYSKEPIGKNTIGKMMQRISGKAGLSQIYTCHSVRASTITRLFQAGIPTQNIIAVTKHRSTSSLSHYIEGLSSGQKRDCGEILTAALKLPSSLGQVNNVQN